MATESILLSGARIKSCMLATPFFGNIQEQLLHHSATGKQNFTSVMHPLCMPLKADIFLKGSLSEQWFHWDKKIILTVSKKINRVNIRMFYLICSHLYFVQVEWDWKIWTMLQKENTNTSVFPRAWCGSDPRIRFLSYTLYSDINRNYLCPSFSPQLLKHQCIQCFLFSQALFIRAVIWEQTHENARVMLTHRALN